MISYIADHEIAVRDGLRIGWWHLGSDIPPRPDQSRIRKTIRQFLATKQPVFVTVGTVEPRKRHSLVLDAMECLWAEGCEACLLILGKEGWSVGPFVRRLRHHPELGSGFYGLAQRPMQKLGSPIEILPHSFLHRSMRGSVYRLLRRSKRDCRPLCPIFRYIVRLRGKMRPTSMWTTKEC